MSTAKTFTTNPININSFSFYPRNYDPVYLFAKEKLNKYPYLGDILSQPVTGGSTPPAYMFCDKDTGIPFVKTSAVSRHFINVNDLYYIDKGFHNSSIKRSITKPYDIIFTMTGKFMGKAALCPPTINELNISQNSVLLRTDSPLRSAFVTIFLNSEINRIQVKGEYSITKQKFINQGKISKLRVVPYRHEFDTHLEDYINAIDMYYNAIDEINKTVSLFSNSLSPKDNFNQDPFDFTIKAEQLSKTLLLPNYYRTDVKSTIEMLWDSNSKHFNLSCLSKGNEVGSSNYTDDGVPFIKTSDIMNYDVDYEPDCYCSEAFINQLSQNVKKGDIIFTKDGKPGQVAIIQEDANIVLSSGLVKYRPLNSEELYWLFLLLSSSYGKAYFKKWFVIASTMTHLRKDFFSDFLIPSIDDKIRALYLSKLEKYFKLKEDAYMQITTVKQQILDEFIQ